MGEDFLLPNSMDVVIAVVGIIALLSLLWVFKKWWKR